MKLPSRVMRANYYVDAWEARCKGEVFGYVVELGDCRRAFVEPAEFRRNFVKIEGKPPYKARFYVLVRPEIEHGRRFYDVQLLAGFRVRIEPSRLFEFFTEHVNQDIADIEKRDLLMHGHLLCEQGL